MASTAKYCGPLAKPDCVNGEVQALYGPVLKLHWNVAVTFALNEILTLVELVRLPTEVLVMVATGIGVGDGEDLGVAVGLAVGLGVGVGHTPG